MYWTCNSLLQCSRMREISFCLRNAYGLPIVGMAIAGKICSSRIRSWVGRPLASSSSSSSQINWLAAKIYSSGGFPRKRPNWLHCSPLWKPPGWGRELLLQFSTKHCCFWDFQDSPYYRHNIRSFMNICFMHPIEVNCVISALHEGELGSDNIGKLAINVPADKN